MPSTIEWTDETWNPVTGCTRVSPGCDNCYMFAMYPRLRAMGVRGYESEPQHVRLLPERLATPLNWKRPRRVFVNSMSDVFHPRVPFEFVHRIFDVMRQAGDERGHVFQVLTKRPGLAVAWWNEYRGEFDDLWPANVWIGTSVESQKYAPTDNRARACPRPHPVRVRRAATGGGRPQPLARFWRRTLGDSGRRERALRQADGPGVGAEPARPVRPRRSAVFPQAARRAARQALRRPGCHRRAHVDGRARISWKVSVCLLEQRHGA